MPLYQWLVLISGDAGRRWIKQMFIGAFLIPAMVCGTAFFINFIAIYYHASRAIPFGTMVSCVCVMKTWCWNRPGRNEQPEAEVDSMSNVCLSCCRLPCAASASSSFCRSTSWEPFWGGISPASRTSPAELTLCRGRSLRRNGTRGLTVVL